LVAFLTDGSSIHNRAGAFLMCTGIRRMGPGNASIISSIGSVGTLVLAYLLLDENITLSQTLGVEGLAKR